MPLPLTPELYWLTLTCLMTGLFWDVGAPGVPGRRSEHPGATSD
mgnify:CR=1 FL=1